MQSLLRDKVNEIEKLKGKIRLNSRKFRESQFVLAREELNCTVTVIGKDYFTRKIERKWKIEIILCLIDVVALEIVVTG